MELKLVVLHRVCLLFAFKTTVHLVALPLKALDTLAGPCL